MLESNAMLHAINAFFTPPGEGPRAGDTQAFQTPGPAWGMYSLGEDLGLLGGISVPAFGPGITRGRDH